MSCDILLTLIDPDPNQPRQHFDKARLEELAQSMDANGLAVPISVRPTGERFIIVHGERRYRAALSLRWEAIRAEVRDVSPDEARWLSLVKTCNGPIYRRLRRPGHFRRGYPRASLKRP